MAVGNSVAVVGNWIAFILAVVAVELGLMHHAHSLTTSLASVVHWVYLGVVNFLVGDVPVTVGRQSGDGGWVGGCVRGTGWPRHLLRNHLAVDI